MVAIGLALCALLIAATAGMYTLPLFQMVLIWLTHALAVVLLLPTVAIVTAR